MILENGVVRTMDARAPVQRALAIAGDRVAGGVGTHETALAAPDVVDLGGRCVLPASPTRTSTSRPGRWLSGRSRLDGAASLDEALDAASRPRRAPGRWLRGHGWRDGDWQPTRHRRRRRSTRHRATRRRRSSPTTTTRSGSTRPGSRSRTATSTSRAASSSGTGAASRRASCARSRPGGSRSGTSPCPTTSTWTRCATASGRGLARRHRVHDKDGWLGALRLWQRLHEQRALTLRVWQSIPHEHLDRSPRLGVRPGLGDEYLQHRLPEGVHGRHARVADRAHARRLGRRDHERRGAGGDRPPRRARPAGRWPCTRSATSRTATRSTPSSATREHWQPLGLRQRIEHAQCLAPRICPASPRSASPPPSSSATHHRTATLPSGSGPTSSKERTRSVR